LISIHIAEKIEWINFTLAQSAVTDYWWIWKAS